MSNPHTTLIQPGMTAENPILVEDSPPSSPAPKRAKYETQSPSANLPMLPLDSEFDRCRQELIQKGWTKVRVLSKSTAKSLATTQASVFDKMNAHWRNIGFPGANGCGILKTYRAASTMTVWLCRLAMHRVFEGIYDLPCCVSIDSLAFGVVRHSNKPTTLPPHVDMSMSSCSDILEKLMSQCHGDKFPYMVQSQLCLVSQQDGPCFTVGRLLKDLPANKHKDFTPLPHYDGPLTHIHLEPGEAVLWRSSLVHSNFSGTATRAESPLGLTRLGVFVSATPKKYRTHTALEQKRKRAKEGLNTAHPAHFCVKDGGVGHMANPKDESDPRHVKPLPPPEYIPEWVDKLL